MGAPEQGIAGKIGRGLVRNGEVGEDRRRGRVVNNTKDFEISIGNHIICICLKLQVIHIFKI